METAVFAAGCFWGVEEYFADIPGVHKTEVGYTGGTKEHPTYEEVCRHGTGHAEAVKIEFDPQVISYETLVRKFFKLHDPTTLNRQGGDVGDQYRSAIFYTTPEQYNIAEQVKNELEMVKVYSRPIVTEIVPVAPWFKAEEYHQQYNKKRGGGTCHV